MLHDQQVKIDFSDGQEISEEFILLENILEDRGSKYSVSGGRVANRADVQQFLKRLKSKKKYAKATHNTWAARIVSEGKVFETKNDDGETGAGMVILRQMQKANITNGVICVTRWFGGVYLQGDRFRHVQDATKIWIENQK